MIKTLSIRSRSRTEFIDITDEINKIVKESGVKNGICYIYIPHTTAGITINEGADTSVQRDILTALNRLVPFAGDYQHLEGNSAAHIKSSLMGVSVAILIEDTRLLTGTWQSVFFCEFDGPRQRNAYIRIT